APGVRRRAPPRAPPPRRRPPPGRSRPGRARDRAPGPSSGRTPRRRTPRRTPTRRWPRTSPRTRARWRARAARPRPRRRPAPPASRGGAAPPPPRLTRDPPAPPPPPRPPRRPGRPPRARRRRPSGRSPPGRGSRLGPAHGQRGDPDVGLPHTRRHALTGLAAVAARDVEVARDPVDRTECLQPVSDQRRAAHRRRDLPSLDQVALGHAEHEVAGGRLHLPAAEGHRVE